MSQIEVPITTTNVPGSSTPTPGTETNESTFPTATATTRGSPTLFATSVRSVPALRPERDELVAELLARVVEPGIRGLEVLGRRQPLGSATTSP